MVAIWKFFLFAAPVLSGVIVERQQSVIFGDLQLIDSDVRSLTGTVNAFDGSASKGVAVQNAYTKLDNDIKSATSRANSSPVLSSADSKTDIAYITGTLEPDVKASINALIAKKTAFTNAGFKSTVCSDLRTLLTDTTAYANALVSKASSDQKTAAGSARDKIIADINAGIAQFC